MVLPLVFIRMLITITKKIYFWDGTEGIIILFCHCTMASQEEAVKGIEDKLDCLFENKTFIPGIELHDLYVKVIGLPDSEASMRIMKKFTFLNVFPIEWGTKLWSLWSESSES